MTRLENLAIKSKSQKLLQHLKDELMMLGLMSLLLFIITSANNKFGSGKTLILYESFELAHIIILFMAFAFLIQALFLVRYIQIELTRFLKYIRLDVEVLIEDYKRMLGESNMIDETSTNWDLWIFDNMPFWLPSFSNFRDSLEFKIIEKLFLQQHLVPDEFDFHKYISKLFMEYISELGEITPFNWFLLSIVILVNYVKIKAVDGDLIEEVCPEEYASASTYYGSYRRNLGSTGKEVCYPYLLQYAMFSLSMLTLYNFINYFANSVYYRRIIILAIKNCFQLEYSEQDRGHVYTHCLVKLKEFQSERKEKEDELKASVTRLMNDLRAKEEKVIHDRQMQKNSPDCYQRFYYRYYKHIHVPLFGEHDIEGSRNDEIFAFQWPGMFFMAIEFNFLLQCFYLAIYFTQLLPIISYHAEEKAAWVIGLTVPIFINFFLIQQMLTRTILLHCSCHLDKDIVAEVCEETINENCILESVRADVLRFCPIEEKTVIGLFTFMKMQFEKSAQAHPGYLLNKSELRSFFHYCQVYLTAEKLEICWEVMDYDVSGHISFDEIFAFIQPDSTEILKQKLESAKVIKQGIIDTLERRGVPRDMWGKELFKIFSQYDLNKNGSIDAEELRNMITSLGIMSNITVKQFNIIQSILDTNMDGTISWNELNDFIFPSDETLTLAYRIGFSSLDEVKSLRLSSKKENIVSTPSAVNTKIDTEVDGRNSVQLIEMSRARINSIKFKKGQDAAKKKNSFDEESNGGSPRSNSHDNDDGIDDTGFEVDDSPKEKKKKSKKKKQDRMKDLNALLTGGNIAVQTANVEEPVLQAAEKSSGFDKIIKLFNRK